MRPFLLKVTVIVGAVMATASVAASITLAKSYVNHDFQLYLKESACVQKHVVKGTPRKNIKTSNGKCWVEWE